MQETQTELSYWLAAVHAHLSPVKLRRWLQQVPDIRELFQSSIAVLAALGASPRDLVKLRNPDWRAVSADQAWSAKPGRHLVTLNDPAYPRLLKELPDAPLVLYVQGDVSLLSRPQIAIVGTRNPTTLGRETATQFAQVLAQAGLVITSGLAAGIDGACHRGALAVSLPTIAVLGTGLNHVYPDEHRGLAEAIAKTGALLSEFPPGLPAIAKNFPRRNRIISGLSLGVVVVEAARRSGSLITARFAAEQGRDVFAMPGSIHNPLARGCHQLIQQGAKLIETADDIIEELKPLWQAATSPPPTKSSPQMKIQDKKLRDLWLQIDDAVTPLDSLMLRSGLTAGEVSSMLLALELQGWVVAEPGGFVRRYCDSS